MKGTVYAPKVIRFSVTGLLDSGRLFFLSASLFLFFRLTDHAKFRDALLLGISLGLLSVSRGEGFPIAVLLLCGVPVLMELKKQKFSLFRKGGCFLTAAGGFALMLFPFCLGNWIFYHAFVPDVRMLSLKMPAVIQPVESPVSIPEAESVLEFAFQVFNNTLRGAYEFYAVFALAGAVLLFLRKKWSWEYTIFLGIYLVHTIMYAKISTAYRYSIYLVPLFMPFTMTGIGFCWKFIRIASGKILSRRGWKIFCAAGSCAVAVLLLNQAGNGLELAWERDRTNRAAGAFLRQAARQAGIPGRGRIVAFAYPEVVFWSGMEAVINYKSASPVPNLEYFRDYDFLLLGRKQKIQPGKCPWLKALPLPPEIAKKYQIFQMDRK